MKKPRYFTLNDETWRAGFIFAFGGNFSDAVRHYRKNIGEAYEEEDPDRSILGRTHYHINHKNCLVWFRDKTPDPGIVAHECFHAATHILWKSGVTLTDHTKEAWAYLLDRLVRFVNESRRKIK